MVRFHRSHSQVTSTFQRPVVPANNRLPVIILILHRSNNTFSTSENKFVFQKSFKVHSPRRTYCQYQFYMVEWEELVCVLCLRVLYLASLGQGQRSAGGPQQELVLNCPLSARDSAVRGPSAGAGPKLPTLGQGQRSAGGPQQELVLNCPLSARDSTAGGALSRSWS